MSLQGQALLKAGRVIKNSYINPARWAEGLAHTLGFRMRKKVPQRLLEPEVPKVDYKPQVGTPERTIVDPFGNTHKIPASQDYQAEVQAVAGKPAKWSDEVPYHSRPLSGGGMLMHTLGYGSVVGAGTLGYNMFKGDGTEPSRDTNGVKNPAYNEEMAKFRSKFQQDYLGGDRTFSAPKYNALRQRGQWINTAIEQMGRENYLAMKQGIVDGKVTAEEMNSALTDALIELGDYETMKQAATEPYVLPGLATKGKSKRVIVIAPMKGKKGEGSVMQALQYALKEDQQEQQGQQ